jgi:hypothetical protein
LGHQEAKLLREGIKENEISELDFDWDKFTEKEKVAFYLARRLTLEPHLISDKDIDLCRSFYNDLQIIEIICSVAGNNAINRWKEGIGVPQSKNGGGFMELEEHSYLTDTPVDMHSKIIFQKTNGKDCCIPTEFK